MNAEVKPPFPIMILDSAPVMVQNRFGGGSIELSPMEVAVYDVITGAEMLGLYSEVRKGLDWFRKHNPEAYMVLLD